MMLPYHCNESGCIYLNKVNHLVTIMNDQIFFSNKILNPELSMQVIILRTTSAPTSEIIRKTNQFHLI